MTRVVQSFSVPDGSIAHAILKEWKLEGINVSTRIQMIIEESLQTGVIKSLKKWREEMYLFLRSQDKLILDEAVQQGLMPEGGEWA